jgi:hypothetical protein
MRRLIGVAIPVVLALLAGCGGGSAGTKAKHPDGGGGTSGTAGHPMDAPVSGTDAPADTEGVSDGGARRGQDAPGGDTSGAAGAGGDGGLEAAEASVDGLDAADGAPDAGDVEAAAPRLVTVAFTGEVVTVAGTPLGFDSTVRTEPVSGSFTYDLRMIDDLPSDPKRGRWQAGGTTAFTFTVKGHTVTGSGHALLETQNLDPDTFRFRDGPQGDGVTRTMKLDGVDAPAMVLFIAITDTTGAMLTSDALPDPFPMLNIANKDGGFEISHTFSIEDASGTLLTQLATLAQQ